MKINDYYKILGLKFKFSELTLLKKYFKTVRIALAKDNREEFIKAQMGFEVLRADKTLEEYNRIYRKYILNEELNFPAARERQMFNAVQMREELGRQEANEMLEKNETFRIYLLKFFLGFLLSDLLHIFDFGASGIVFIVGGFYVAYRNHDQTNLIGGIFLCFLGLYFLRRNLILSINVNDN